MCLLKTEKGKVTTLVCSAHLLGEETKRFNIMATSVVYARCLLAWKVLLSSNKAFCYEVLKSSAFSWRIIRGIPRQLLHSLKVRLEIYPLLELLLDYCTMEGDTVFVLHILPYSSPTSPKLLNHCYSSSVLPPFPLSYLFLSRRVTNPQLPVSAASRK